LITLALTSQVVGWLLIAVSLPRLPAALTSLLLTIQPVGSIALAAIIFAESPSGLQLVGVAMVLGALLTATASPEQVLFFRAKQRRRSRAVVRGDVAPGSTD
jgi:drug/metabolite transporter (DMT)-like permease